ncbi:Fungal specific transcription factor domain [Ceratobasidium sp. AG-Ba]|nr:Fungal specific transcription factor domain [Ceratobasidium sp. AG-Ba]
MDYAQMYPNQRPAQNAYYNQHQQQQQYTGQGYPYPQQQQQQQAYAEPTLNSYQQWQQQHAQYQPQPPRYSQSPRQSLSPPYTGPSSSEPHMTPSPLSSTMDHPWSGGVSTRWITPSPLISPESVDPVVGTTTAWPPSGEFTFKNTIAGNGNISPSGTGTSTGDDKDNERWAIGTARGKKQRTDEKEKARSGACRHCKRLKMKCTFDPPNAATCQRCRSSGQDCVVEGRKPRKNSEPLEQLSAQIEDKEEIIQGLLRIIHPPQTNEHKPDSAQVWKWIERGARSLMLPPSGIEPETQQDGEENLPVDSTPFGLLADLSLNDREDKSTGRERSVSKAAGEDGEVGVANAEYFKPGPMAHPELRRIIVERQMVPEILTLGVVTEDEVEHLFRIFHERIDAVIAIIDPVIHTVAGVKARCPFLFTVICAVASRYWIERPELYTVLMHHAKAAAAMAITDGWKSLEPARSWEEDRAWLFLGCAIRMAMDLNLYKQGAKTFVNEAHEREVLNRTRTWLICFNMDRALATRLGRPTTIPEDYIVRHSRDWWRRSKYNGRLDVHLCFYTQLLRTVTRYFSLIYSDPESLSGFNESTEFGPITRAFDDEMEQFRQDAEHTYSTAPDAKHPACQYRLALVRRAISYYRLVMYSFGLEHAHRSSLEPGNMFLTRSIDTASEVVRITNEDLPIYDFHRYSPDGHWMWSVFAAAFLIKLAKPRSNQPGYLTMTPAQRDSSMALVRKFITTLEYSAVDNRHAPALYARYLKKILGEPGHVNVTPSHSPNAGPQSPKPSDAAASPITVPYVTSSGLVPPRPSSAAGPKEDVLAAMYSLSGDFWDNSLLPGTWGIAAGSGARN